MSQQLMDAIKAGDLEQVEMLVADPNTDINFIGKIDPSYLTTTCKKGARTPYALSPLGTAIVYGYNEIALRLIEHGAKMENTLIGQTVKSNEVWSNYDEYCVNSYFEYYCCALGLALEFEVNNELFKNLLMKSTYTDFPLYINRVGYNSRITIKNFLENYSDLPLNKAREYLKYIICENFLRGADQSAGFDINIIRSLLNDRNLNPEEIFKFKKNIDRAAFEKKIDVQTADKIKEWINLCRYGSIFNIEALSEEAKNTLKDKTTSELHVLFAELQYWLFPDENLPPLLANSSFFQTQKNVPAAEIEKIKDWQNPIRLRAFLEQNESAIISRLLARSNLIGDNPAALLLATLLQYKSQAKIKVDDHEEIFLSDELRRKGIKALDAFYSIPLVNQVTLQKLDNQAEKIVQLAETINSLQKQMYELKVENKELKNDKARIEAGKAAEQRSTLSMFK